MSGFGKRVKNVFSRSKRSKESSELAVAQPSDYQRDTKPTTAYYSTPKDAEQLTPFQIQARQIAQMPVPGMRRTTGPGNVSSYMSSYETMQSPGRSASSWNQSTTTDSRTTISSGDTTMVDNTHYIHPDKEVPIHARVSAKGAWQGKPNGTPYDRREELTEEDEDMWARMAM